MPATAESPLGRIDSPCDARLQSSTLCIRVLMYSSIVIHQIWVASLCNDESLSDAAAAALPALEMMMAQLLKQHGHQGPHKGMRSQRPRPLALALARTPQWHCSSASGAYLQAHTGPSPLIAAPINVYSRVCYLLLKGRANVNHVTVHEHTALLKLVVPRGNREVALPLVLMEHGPPSSRDETLTPQMLKDLNKWMAEALKEKSREIAEKDRQIEGMVQGIPEWCAQAASAVLSDDEGKNCGNGSRSSS